MSGSEGQRYLEQELRDRARAAEREYRLSATRARKLIEHSRQLGWDNPDGAYTFHSAIHAERVALEKYRRALVRFTDFLLYQKKPSAQNLLEPLLSRAIEARGADMGTLQVLDRAEGALTIKAQRGFKRPFLDFFAAVHGGRGAACGAALRTGAPVFVDDVRTSPIFEGTPALRIMIEAGALAVQSIPLVGPSGELLGMLSTHHRKPAPRSTPDPNTLAPLAGEIAALITAAGMA